jgi:hypothetical protein
MPLPEEKLSTTVPQERSPSAASKRRLSTRALIFVGIALVAGLSAVIGSILLLVTGVHGIHDTPVNIGGGSIYGSVGSFHFFHEDTKYRHYHAGRNFASNSQILLTCVSQPSSSKVQDSVTVPIQNGTSWNLRISTKGNVKPNIASACSNADCDLSHPPDPSGSIHVTTELASNGWIISPFGGKLTYFDNTPGCAPPSSGGESACLDLTYLTLELPTGYTPLPSGCKDSKCTYACDQGKCQVYMGGPTSTTPNPNPPVCP